MLALLETALKIKRLAKEALDTSEGNYRMYTDQLNKAWSMSSFDELITFVTEYLKRGFPANVTGFLKNGPQTHVTISTKADYFDVIINREDKDAVVLFRVAILDWTHVRVLSNRKGDRTTTSSYLAREVGNGLLDVPHLHIVDYGRGDTDALNDRVIDELLRLE